MIRFFLAIVVMYSLPFFSYAAYSFVRRGGKFEGNLLEGAPVNWLALAGAVLAIGALVNCPWISSNMRAMASPPPPARVLRNQAADPKCPRTNDRHCRRSPAHRGWPGLAPPRSSPSLAHAATRSAASSNPIGMSIAIEPLGAAARRVPSPLGRPTPPSRWRQWPRRCSS